MDNNQDDISVILGYDASKLDAQEKSIIDKINKFAKSIGNAAKGIDISVDTEKLKSDIKKATASSNKDFISASRERIKSQEMLNRNIVNMEIQLAGTTTKIQSNMLKERILATKKAVDEQSFLYKKDAQNFIDANKKKIAESNKAQKEFARTSGSVLSTDTGTTFGHKALTTSQYMIAGAALFKVQQAMSSVIKESMAYDDAIYNNMAVLKANRKEAEHLAITSRELSVVYGGNIKDIDELTLVLGRAGVKIKDLAAASKVAVEMAKLTGDTFQSSAEVMSSFITSFITNNNKAGLSVEQLGSKLAYMANESRLSVQDLGTVGNYALTTASSIGLTIDSIGALITSFSNMGVNTSTIGTQIRKLNVIFTATKQNVTNFWKEIGLSQEETLFKIKQSDKGLQDFIRHLSKENMPESVFLAATRDMEIYEKDLLTKLRNMNGLYEQHYNGIRKGVDLATQAQIKSMGATTMVEKVWNTVITSADGAVSNLMDSAGRDEINRLNEDFLAQDKVVSKLYLRLGQLSYSSEEYRKVSEELAIEEEKRVKLLDEVEKAVESVNDAIKGLENFLKVGGVAIEVSMQPFKKITSFLFDKWNGIYGYIKEIQDAHFPSIIEAVPDKGSTNNTNNTDSTKDSYDESMYIDVELAKKMVDNERQLIVLRAKGVDELKERLILQKEIANKMQEEYDLLKENSIINPKNTAQMQQAEMELLKAKKAVAATEKQIASEKERTDKEEASRLEKLAKLQDETSKARLDIAQISMSEYEKKLISITQKEQEWLKAKVDMQTVEEGTRALREQLDLERAIGLSKTELDYAKEKLSLQAYSYEKEVSLAELQYANRLITIASMKEEQDIINEMLIKEWELQQLRMNNIMTEDNIKNIDSALESQTSLLDTQLELIDATDAWGNSFERIAGNIANISSAMGKLGKIEIANKKQQLKLDANLAKVKEKYGEKSIEYAEAENEAIMSKSQLAISSQKAELDGWANIAGAMSGAFKEGSDAALAFKAIQVGIATVSAVQALITAWADPTVPAIVKAGYVATVAANVAQLLSIIGGGSGGGSSSKSYSQAEIDKFNIEAEYTPMIDRLDRQIELLEKIERNGSAGAIKVDLAGVTFERDYKLLVNEFLTNVHNELKSSWGLGSGVRASNEKQFEDMLGFNLGDMSGSKFVIDKNSLKQGLNLMRLVETINANWDYFHNSGFGVLLDKDWKQAGDPMSMTVARIGQITNDMQELLHEYTMSLLDSMEDLKDAKEEYISIYEELTDSRIFTDKKLADAFKSFDSLLSSGESYADYIYKEINNLQNLEKFLTNDKINILLSQDPTNLKAQLDLLDELKRETGLTFQNGARDAIDFLESIKLVSEALVTSRNNINSFVESFMSDYDLLEKQSKKMGIGIAKSFDELFLQFQTMASDAFGLTDEELSYLKATKSYLEEQNDKEIKAIEEQIDLQEKLLDTIEKNISTIEGIMNSLKSTIDKLRDSADDTNTYTLNKFYESMAKTQELMKSKDYEAIAKSIQETIGYSSALSDAKNFTLTRDMQYAQLVAAKQFEDMDIALKTELDYLKMIEKNTRDTVSRLKDMIEALGATIANAFDKNSQAIKNLMAELEKGKEKDKPTVTKLVNEIYTKYDLHKYQKDDSGYKHWENQVLSGAIPISQLETAIKNTAQKILSGSSGGGSSSSSGGGGSTSTPSTSDLVKSIYTKYDLHKYQTDDSGYKHWENQVLSGAIPVSQLETAIKNTADKILGTKSFAVGTPNVPRDMLANIHKGETIIPTTFSEGLRRGDLMLGETNQLSNLLVDVISKLNGIIIQQGLQTATLMESRDIQNGSLVMLENIEGII